MQWDVFCRVIDHFGDIGVCWRLACELGARGHRVRLWADEASALAWMAPGGAANVEVLPWASADVSVEPGDVVIETFGCDPPVDFVRRMALRATAPLWINLEYLSAEPYVERSHRLPSPVLAGAGQGLTKWFFYPGFTPATGGLIREADLAQRQRSFDRTAWLASQGAQPRAGERMVSLFCYANPLVPELLARLGERPTLLLATAGVAAAQVQAAVDVGTAPGMLRVQLLPLLTQRDYDHLLWSADLNFVRGEDSFVRAMWAGAPFVWQAYPQQDATRADKLAAFLRRHLAGAGPDLAAHLQRLWQSWNGLGPGPLELARLDPWRELAHDWRASLLGQPDLVTQLLGFVAKKS
jgi:uncharacterized repeat protein (TIGR03837 family)